jgi:superfamily II DNA or RNA helicase
MTEKQSDAERKKDTEGTRRRLSRKRKPEDMTVEQWQVALRRRYGRKQDFQMENVGGRPLFSEFAVTNPESGHTYRVAIRGEQLGVNYCSCPDFAVNTLGTCKHIEFALGELGDNDETRERLRRGHNPPFSEVFVRYGPERKVEFSPGSEAPRELREMALGYFRPDGALREEAVGTFGEFVERARSRFDHELHCYDDALELIAEKRDAAHRKRVIDEKYGGERGDERLDDLLHTDLYRYQKEGVRFAARAGRALLADDMGLGKTPQAIAAAELMAREFGLERVLVICPASLKHQWAAEIEKFCDRPALVIEGSADERPELYRRDGFFKIMNYELAYRDEEGIDAWDPELVVLDAAQRIKHWKTLTAKGVKRIDSEYALVLTGTPLENRLEELHSIVEFVDMHRLGPLFRFLADHQVTEPETGRVVGDENLDRISATLEPILLRRTRGEVLDQLPDRTEKNFLVHMTSAQREIHEDNRKSVAALVAKWRKNGYLTETQRHILMACLQRMRMACDNAYLVDQETLSGPKLDELETLVGEILERPDEKVVIFSQWKRMNDLVAGRLEEADIPFLYLHGSVPSPKRKDLLEAFWHDEDTRIFLSTDAGGTGLNLQRASALINLDLPWNPAVLEQRIGRVHRVGQTRKVRVTNFVSEGTIEHGMLRRLAFKEALFEGVLEGGADTVFLDEDRMEKLMKGVEKLSDATPATAHEPPPEPEPEEPVDRTEKAPRPAGAEALSSIAPLIDTGIAFLQGLKSAAEGETPETDLPFGVQAETDEATGRDYIKVPMPDPDQVQQVLGAVGPLLQSLVENLARQGDDEG